MELEVQTKYGPLKGRSRDGVYVWKGIPYAKPPIDELRFAAPVSPEPWTEVREAYTYGPENIQPRQQMDLFGNKQPVPEESEDCLYLNVWAPEDPGDVPLPVMVWIHGGAFVGGSGSNLIYDGSKLANRGKVIVVTLNYRLGPFGFMHLSPLGDGFTSNCGLLDQIAALIWVKDNISAFGGNPDAVTIFGESAGSMSVAALLAMPEAQGLFHRAIMQSGASQALSADQASSITGGLLNILGIHPDEAQKLKALPAQDIFMAAERLKAQYGNGLGLLFQPVIDSNTLPAAPIAAIKNGVADDIPLLIGTNLDEGALFFRPDSPLMGEEELIKAMAMMTGAPNAAEIARSYPRTTEGQAQIMTDLYFWRSAVKFAQEQSEHAPVWMYRFDWTLPSHPVLNKAIHAAEIPFVFNNLELFSQGGVSVDSDTQQLADRIQGAWISFAYGSSPDIEGTEWLPYNKENRNTLLLNHELTLIGDPDRKKRELLGI
ncbi:carboxylesterase/lipase family protein [Neobacillus mesonae]|nr:carboxylesterase/lipase family protein [Neobacillus mesonae]